MTYRIEVWRYGTVVEEKEFLTFKDAKKWFADEWLGAWWNGGCAFHLYKNNKLVDWEEKSKMLDTEES